VDNHSAVFVATQQKYGEGNSSVFIAIVANTRRIVAHETVNLHIVFFAYVIFIYDVNVHIVVFVYVTFVYDVNLHIVFVYVAFMYNVNLHILVFVYVTFV
jgi:hypothetical protein